ncbi:MAG TPA: MFS transporter [Candidatus Eisenbacteria bacterium]|nr:MFS transporter [Candidatus Eisenbacteria bacterium]
MSRYQWALLGLLTGFWGLVGINRLGIQFVFPFIVPLFHLSVTQVSLLVTGTSFTWAFSSWASGWLSDRYGRRTVLLPGAAFACLTTMLQGVAWNFLSLFVIRDLVGIGDGVGWPNGQSTLAEEVPAQRRAVAAGVFTAGYPFFGSVIGGFIIPPMAKQLGWQWVFPILGGVFLLVVLALWVVMREPRRSVRPERLDLRDAFRAARDRRVLVLMLIQSGALGWLQVGVVLNVLFLTRVLHASPVLAGQVVAYSGIAAIAGTLVLPALSDYIGRRPAVLGGGLLSAVLLGMYILGHFPIGISAALLAANAFFEAVIIPLGSATCVAEVVGEEGRATAMGSVNFVGVVIGTLLLPLAAGIVADRFGLGTAYLIAVACVAIAGLLMLTIPETAPRVLSRRARAVATA